MLQGCVQPSMMPNIDSAAARVLDGAGIQTVYADGSGCCGALRTHLSDHSGGLADMRRNIDAWIPMLDRGEVEAIVSSASACGLAVKEYAHALAGDIAYRDKAARVSAAARDLSELLPDLVPALKDRVRPRRHAHCLSLALHPAARPQAARRRGSALADAGIRCHGGVR